MIVNKSPIFLFEFGGHRTVLIWITSLMLITLLLLIHWIIVHTDSMWLLWAHSLALTTTALFGRLSILITMYLLDSLSACSYIIQNGFIETFILLFVLTTTVLTVDYDLVSVVSKIIVIHYLLLCLNLLVVGQLCGIIHVYFSAFLEVHVTRGVKHWWVCATSPISILIIVHLKGIKIILSYNYKDNWIQPFYSKY